MGGPRIPDDDPTLEEELPEFDGSGTDQLDDSYRLSVVSSSEHSAGKVDHDHRGTSRWKWNTENENGDVAPEDRTFNHLKALDHPTLHVEGEDPPQPDEGPGPRPKAGYDPYATAPSKPKPKPPRKPWRGSSDATRTLPTKAGDLRLAGPHPG